MFRTCRLTRAVHVTTRRPQCSAVATGTATPLVPGDNGHSESDITVHLSTPELNELELHQATQRRVADTLCKHGACLLPSLLPRGWVEQQHSRVNTTFDRTLAALGGPGSAPR